MWKQADKHFVYKVLAFTFVGNVLSVLLPYLCTGYMEFYRIGFGVEMFMKWPWFMLAFAATAANLMFSYIALVNAKLESSKFDGDIVGYITLLGMVLFLGFHPTLTVLGISSDSALLYVYTLFSIVNWVSVVMLRKPIARRIISMALSLENSGVLAAAAKRAAEGHEEWVQQRRTTYPGGYVPSDKAKF